MRLRRLLGRGTGKTAASDQDLSHFLHQLQERGTITPDQLLLVNRILRARDIEISEVMVPRLEMTTLSVEAPVEEIISTFRRSGFSRLPVYDQAPENIVGILHVRELLRVWDTRDRDLRAVEFIRLPAFIPGARRILDALRDFRKERISIAMVIDEYGSISGLVTMDDLLEEIVGELRDEFDREEKLVVPEEQGFYLVDPRVRLEELARILGIDLEMPEVRTVGGFILARLGRIPRRGERFRLGALDVEILAARQQKVEKVRLRKVEEEPDKPEVES